MSIKMLILNSLLIFVFLSTCSAPDVKDNLKESENTNKKYEQKLMKSENILKLFEYHFDDMLKRESTTKMYGPLMKEYITFDIDEEVTDPVILLELKRLYVYFFANASAKNSPRIAFVNFFTTHIAKWMNLSYQTCILFYTDDARFEEIVKNCKRISELLNLFVSTLSRLRSPLLAKFKEESPDHIKTTEQIEERAEAIAKRLEAFLKITTITDPAIQQCDEIKEDNEEKYCRIWMKQLMVQSMDFKLNHVFFHIYDNLKNDNFDTYDVYDYTSDYNNSIQLWNFSPELFSKVAARRLPSASGEIKIVSEAVSILQEIVNFKLSKFNIKSIPVVGETSAREEYVRTIQIDEEADDRESDEP